MNINNVFFWLAVMPCRLLGNKKHLEREVEFILHWYCWNQGSQEPPSNRPQTPMTLTHSICVSFCVFFSSKYLYSMSDRPLGFFQDSITVKLSHHLNSKSVGGGSWSEGQITKKEKKAQSFHFHTCQSCTGTRVPWDDSKTFISSNKKHNEVITLCIAHLVPCLLATFNIHKTTSWSWSSFFCKTLVFETAVILSDY